MDKTTIDDRLKVCYVGPDDMWVRANYSRVCALYPDADVRGFNMSSLLPRPSNGIWRFTTAIIHDGFPNRFRISSMRRLSIWLDECIEQGVAVIIEEARR